MNSHRLSVTAVVATFYWTPACAPAPSASDDGGVYVQDASYPDQEPTDWRQAMTDLAISNVAQYSYLPFYGVTSNSEQSLQFGLRLLFGLRQNGEACPTSRETVRPGWSVYVNAADKQEGTYLYDWEHESSTLNETQKRFSVSVEYNGPDEYVKRYRAFSGTLHLSTTVVDYMDADNAQLVAGTLVLRFPATSVWEVSCSAAAMMPGPVIYQDCQCLVNDDTIVACSPEDGSDLCCRSVVPPEEISFEIPFIAKPCAALCAGTALTSEALCDPLLRSDFDNVSSP